MKLFETVLVTVSGNSNLLNAQFDFPNDVVVTVPVPLENLVEQPENLSSIKQMLKKIRDEILKQRQLEECGVFFHYRVVFFTGEDFVLHPTEMHRFFNFEEKQSWES